MATGLQAIRRAGGEAVRSHLVPVVTALGLAMALVWAPSEPVATAPAPVLRAEAQPRSVCLASPIVKRPCEPARRAAPVVLGPVKATRPSAPFYWTAAAEPVRLVALAASPDWIGPGRLAALAHDAAPGPFAPAVPTRRPQLAAWAGEVRPVPRGTARIAPVKTASRQAAPAALAGIGPLHVQVGAYARGANAERAVATLRALGFGVGERPAQGGAMRAIAAGPFGSEVEAAVALAALREAGFAGAYLTR